MNRINDRSFLELADALEEGRMSRATFVRRAVAAGFSLSLIAQVTDARAALRGPRVQSAAERRLASQATIVIAGSDTPPSLDHAFQTEFSAQQAFQNVYATPLMWRMQPYSKDQKVSVPDFTSSPAPWFVRDWEISKDHKSITFSLRKGVKSEHGNELTADDVVWSFKRDVATKGVSGGFIYPVIGFPADGVDKVDKYTVRYHSKKTSPILMPIFANMYTYWWDSTEAKKHATKDDPWAEKWLTTNSSGFGPYKVTQWQPGTQVVFDRNPNYPYAVKNGRVVYKAIPSSSTRLALLAGGGVDVAENLAARDREQARKTPNVVVHDYASNWQQMIEMNAKSKPFDNKLVRQALAWATPYQDILSAVYRGHALQMTSPIPFIYPGSKKQRPYAYNPDKARALLKQAGFPNGFRATLSFDAARTEQEQISILMQSALAKIGVHVQLAKVPSSTFSDLQTKRKLDFFFWQDMPIQPDPGYALFLYYYGPAFTTYSNYNNPRVNKLIEVATGTPDGAKRTAALDAAQKLIWDDCPHLWLAWPGWHYATRSNVSGANWNPANETRWELMAKA
jgi:peptide/nickel transport system substrate-binding protein